MSMRAAARAAMVLAVLAAIASATGAAAQPVAPRLAADVPDTPLSTLLRDARAALERGEGRTAYPPLKAAVGRYAGLPDFDRLLGEAALEAGEPGQAILAFERILAERPDDLRARADLGRALLAAGERDGARREFSTVAGQPIPEAVRRRIDGFLRAIDLAEPRPDRASFSGAVDLAVGWDDNVNFGSALGTWVLAGGTAVTPGAVSRPQASPFVSTAASGSFVVPMGGGFEWIGGAQVSHRANPQASTLDLSALDLSTGVNLRKERQLFAVSTSVQTLLLDGDRFRDAVGVTAQWQADLDARTQAGLYGQWFEFRFGGAQAVRDARRQTLGVSFARLFGTPRPGTPLLVGSLYVGQERTTASLPELSFDFHGLRATVSAGLGGGWRGSLSGAWESRRFLGPDTLFGVTRSDRQLEWRAAAETDLGRGWSAGPQIVVTRNASTLAPNDFRRVQAFVSARYRFH